MVLDTEWWADEGSHDRDWSREDEHPEVIQIGALEYSLEKERITGFYHAHVKPRENQKLTEYIKELTGIKQEDVDQAPTLEEAWQGFQDFAAGKPVYSYGDEREVLEINQELYEVDLGLDETEFRDVRYFFEERGVDTEDWSSGTVARYFRPGIRLLEPHDALHDCINLTIAVDEAYSSAD